MTWGLIGSRMQTKFNTQFSFQENLCLQVAFWPRFRPPLRTLFLLELRYTGEFSHCLIELRYTGEFYIAWLNSDTPEIFVIDPCFSDTTEWEKVDKKEKEKGMNDPRETQISTADLMHLHLRHPTMSMRFCYACRLISGRSLSLGKITCHICPVLKRLESFSPGFSGIILRFYTRTYHWHWTNFSGSHNFNNTSTTASVTCNIHHTNTNQSLE